METKIHERTRAMMENFYSHFESGMSIREIAEHYKLSESTVYKKLDTIAKNVGVSRETLLSIPHAPHIATTSKSEQIKKIDIAQACDQLENDIGKLDELLASIEKIIAEIEEGEI